MDIHSFKLDKIFILLVPALVVEVAGTSNFPDEIEFVQTFLPIKSYFVIV
jgi:hypothetical protein